MFCHNCGNEIEEGTLFCSNCGAKQEQVENVAVEAEAVVEAAPVENVTENVAEEAEPEVDGMAVTNEAPVYDYNYAPANPVNEFQPATPVNEFQSANVNNNKKSAKKEKAAPKKKGSKKGVIIAVVAAVALILIGGGIFTYLTLFAKKPVNLNEFVDVEFEGVSGYGVATVTFDSKKFNRAFHEDIKMKKAKIDTSSDSELEDLVEEGDACAVFEHFIKVDVENNGSISNGDELNIVWEIDEETINKAFNLKIENDDKTVKVKDLIEAEVVDPFENAVVTFAGPNGEGRFYTIENVDYIFDFEIDKRDGLSNGDKIVVSLRENSYDPDFYELARNYGIYPSRRECEFTVEGLETYLDTITGKDDPAIADLRKEADKFISEKDTIIKFSMSGELDIEVEDINCVGAALIDKKMKCMGIGIISCSYMNLRYIINPLIQRHYQITLR